VSEAKAEEVKSEGTQAQQETKAETAQAQQDVKEEKAEVTQAPQQAQEAQQANPTQVEMAQQVQQEVQVHQQQEVKEVKEEVKEVKVEVPKPNEEVIKELDALARLLLWASKSRARAFAAIEEIKKNRDKLINTFAEALDPNIYEFIVQIMDKFGLVQADKLPKPRECPECRQSKEELEATLNQIIEFFNNNKEIPPEKKPIAIEKAKRVYSLDYETRIEYLKTALQKTVEYAERNPLDGLMFFLKWLTIDTGPAAYDGALAYPFMARPQYRDAWVKVVVAFMAFVNSFMSFFIS
jgi:hypothetical protein